MPLMMAFISDADWTGLQTALYVVAAVVCGWIPVLLAFERAEKTVLPPSGISPAEPGWW